MSKTRILVAALALSATAGLINCSKMKGNHTTPEEGATLPVSNVDTSAIEARAKLVTDLQEMSEYNYGDEKCAKESIDAIMTRRHILYASGKETETKPAMYRIMMVENDAAKVKVAADQLSSDIQEQDNAYCGLQAISKASTYAFNNFIEKSKELDTESEEYKLLNGKATSVRDSLKDLYGRLKNKAAAYSSAAGGAIQENARLISLIDPLTEELESGIESIRSTYTCQDGDVCSATENFKASIVTKTVAAIQNAEQSKVDMLADGSQDEDVTAKNAVLLDSVKALETRKAVIDQALITFAKEIEAAQALTN